MTVCLAGCGRPARQGRAHGRFCSDACKAEYHRDKGRAARAVESAAGTRTTRPSETRRDLTLRLLRAAGIAGVTTGQLLQAGVGSRYSARLYELRREGFEIAGRPVRNGEWVYTLTGDPERVAA